MENKLTLIANLIVLALVVKVYTEFIKESKYRTGSNFRIG